MVYIRKKEIPPDSGEYYLYMSKTIRTKEKIEQKDILYLGPEEEFTTEELEKILSKYKEIMEE